MLIMISNAPSERSTMACVCHVQATVDAATLQHVGYRPATNAMIEVSQSALNSRISPTRLLRHPEDQR
jgi:hypothetical protein